MSDSERVYALIKGDEQMIMSSVHVVGKWEGRRVRHTL